MAAPAVFEDILLTWTEAAKRSTWPAIYAAWMAAEAQREREFNLKMGKALMAAPTIWTFRISRRDE